MGFYSDDVAVSAASMPHPGASAEKHEHGAKLKKKNNQPATDNNGK